MNKEKSTLFAIYFTFFVDNLSWAIVFPIFTPYFLDPDNALFSPGVSVGTRTMILGFFLTAFSLGQFLGAPVIGEYADRHGRKKALTLCVFFTLIGICLSAWSMGTDHLAWLFLGRLITGVFASSNSVCFSCVSDLSEDEKAKVRRFGFLSMLVGIAFVFGAFIGGKLSDKTLSSDFSASFPLWLAAGLGGINFLFVLLGFRETSIVNPSVQFHFFQSFGHIKMALKTEKIKRLYGIYFLFLFSWTILFQFMPALTVEKFLFTNSDIGDLALFMGVCWAIGSGYLNRVLSQRFDTLHVLELCLVGFTIFCGLVMVPQHIYGVMALLGGCVILGGIGWPICTGLISGMAPREMQGKVLGISQSIQSLAMSLAPIVGGLAFHISLAFPFLIAAGTSLLAAFVYYFTLKNR